MSLLSMSIEWQSGHKGRAVKDRTKLMKNGGDRRKSVEGLETKSGYGSSNLIKAIEETSNVYAFLFKSMDVKPRVKGS